MAKSKKITVIAGQKYKTVPINKINTVQKVEDGIVFLKSDKNTESTEDLKWFKRLIEREDLVLLPESTMKTNLNRTIENAEQAEAYLRELNSNDESYHPDDDAFDIAWDNVNPTEEERTKLNELMEQVFAIENFDPYSVLMDASGMSGLMGDKEISYYTPEYIESLDGGQLKYLIDALEERMKDVLAGVDTTDKMELNTLIGKCIDAYQKFRS